MKVWILGGTLLGVLLWGAGLKAQKAAPPARAGSKSATSSQSGKEPAKTGTAPSRGKERDPFLTLITAPTKAEELPTRLPPGLKGLVIEQLQLKGIARSVDGGWIAVVDNRTKRAFFLHEHDQVYNGAVSKITADSVVFQESGKDSTGKVVSKEVVMRLSPE